MAEMTEMREEHRAQRRWGVHGWGRSIDLMDGMWLRKPTEHHGTPSRPYYLVVGLVGPTSSSRWSHRHGQTSSEFVNLPIHQPSDHSFWRSCWTHSRRSHLQILQPLFPRALEHFRADSVRTSLENQALAERWWYPFVGVMRSACFRCSD